MTVDIIRDETVFPKALMACIGFDAVLSLEQEGASQIRFQARPEFTHSAGTTVQGGSNRTSVAHRAERAHDAGSPRYRAES